MFEQIESQGNHKNEIVLNSIDNLFLRCGFPGHKHQYCLDFLLNTNSRVLPMRS